MLQPTSIKVDQPDGYAPINVQNSLMETSILLESSLIGVVEVKLLQFEFRIMSPRGSLASLRGRRVAAA